MKIIARTYFFLALFAISACTRQAQVNSLSEYLKWINEPQNGLVKTKYVNGIEIKIKYLPSEYLAYKELCEEQIFSQRQKDSVMNLYEHSISFVLSLGPDERKDRGPDIMYHSLTTYKEYSQRVYDMNFFMSEYITLKAGKKEFRPVLSQMENIYGLESKRNIILVFVPNEKGDNSLKESEALEFKYEDQQFQLGTNYFIFKRKDITDIPSIKFWNS